MSEELFKALYSKYAEEPANDFYTATAGLFGYGKARSNWDDNYAVSQAIDFQPDDVFRTTIDDAYFQINVFSSTRSGCWDLLSKCKALFHNTTLTITGHYPSRVARETQIPPIWNKQDNLWQATIEFRCKLQST